MVWNIKDIDNIVDKITKNLKAKNINLARWSTEVKTNSFSIKFVDESLVEKIHAMKDLSDEKRNELLDAVVKSITVPFEWFSEPNCDTDKGYDLVSIPGWDEYSIETKAAIRVCNFVHECYPVWRSIIFREHPELR